MNVTMVRLALIYAGCLFASVIAVDSGSLPSVGVWIHEVPLLDKAIHFVLYGTLALLANLAIAGKDCRSLRRVSG